jgi:cell division protein FtsN
MASRKRRKKEPAPGWAWMLVGLSIGLSVALFVWLKSAPPALPLTTSAAPALTTATDTPASEPEPPPEETAAAGTDPSVTPEPGTGGDELDFYEVLTETELVVPESRIARAAIEDSVRPEVIQAGAFRDIDDADSRQARLAQLGIVSEIRTAYVDDDLWFRVIIGPLQQARIDWTRREVSLPNESGSSD